MVSSTLTSLVSAPGHPPRFWMGLLLLSITGFSSYYYFLVKLPVVSLVKPSFRFHEDSPLARNQLLIDLPGKCQIPATSTWSEEIEPFVKTLPNFTCNEQSRISYIQDNKIFLDFNLLDSLTNLTSPVKCCYKSIHRKQFSLDNYPADAGKNYFFSRKCEHMSDVTIPTSMLVKVECSEASNSSNLVYQKFHAIALLPPQSHPNDTDDMANATSRIRAVVDFWEQCSRKNEFQNVKLNGEALCTGFRTIPPHILLLGMDSTSRLNVRRFMNKTVKFFQRIGAVEMLGYSSIVGENTFPNVLPIITSLVGKQLKTTCERKSGDSLDACPYIWRDFSSFKYLTAHLEDGAYGQIFSTGRTGFVKSPVDIYLRPFIQALYQNGLTRPHCDMYEFVEELMLNFAVDLVTTASLKNVPTFISTWMTDLTHDDINAIQYLDDFFYTSLTKLRQKRILQNTIVFLISDHGYRYLPVRNTLSGHYEAKLPTLWIYIPKRIRKLNPEWLPALTKNRRILATPFDVHATLHHILTSVNSEYMYFEESRSEWGMKTRGKSLLRLLPHRNCTEAHIPTGFCPCEIPVQYEDIDMIQVAAEATVAQINNRLPVMCEPLAVSSVFSSGLIRGSKHSEWNVSGVPSEGDSLVIGIEVNPGQMKFEALIAFDKKSSTFAKVKETLRTNAVSRFPGCLKDKFATGYLKLRCTCKESKN